MKFNELNGKKMRENDKLFHQIVKAKENAQEEVRYLTEQLSLKSRGVNMDSDEALRYQIKDLQDQNLQLSDIISQMRRDMESFAAKKLNTADDSEHQILLNDNQSLNDQVTKLNIILSQKQNMINNLLDQQTNLNESFGRNIGNNGIVIERENEKLRAQLTELKGDLSREMQEKNVLLELSNYLKSELRSFQDTANDSLPKKTEARIQSNEKIAPPKFFVGTKKAPIAPVKLDTKFELRSKGIRNWNEKDD